ncbi:alpha/beta hydrolase [Fulvimarina endophytica]|uniref:Alpha/beta hydrolase n=1 Tax=Fulvimarina endophytica TaxID=2293836 RepID=A0A371X5H0_9HYPH|nr:alpha/beta hydrolase [Fulvimarina endophytica]RFC64473.1 alpha/beta hydrolase [Fulvimarina endophytica]
MTSPTRETDARKTDARQETPHPALESHVHRYVAGTSGGRTPLLALHGTGGDETDLLPLAGLVAPQAAILSPRGAVLENGMPRFFRRLAEGVFDEADLETRTHALADFVEAARAHYGLPAPIALGFSNGANIAAAMLLLRPESLSGAILIRPMVPFAEPPASSPLDQVPVLVLSGSMDPLIAEDQPARLAASLSARGAVVERRTVPAGHGLSQADVTLARAWYEREVAGA